MSEQIPAHIILQQLGGSRRLAAMIGAHNFFHSNEGRTLTFHFKAKAACNVIRITLNALDLYDIELIKVRGTKVTPVSQHENVDAESMTRCIEQNAKVYLSI